MAISQKEKDQVAKLIDDLNLGTKQAQAGQVLFSLIDQLSNRIKELEDKQE